MEAASIVPENDKPNDTERYSDTVQINPYTKKGYVFCSRARCRNDVPLQEPSLTDPYRRWRYDSSIVVVSIEDGTRKYAYCSINCAALDLHSKKFE